MIAVSTQPWHWQSRGRGFESLPDHQRINKLPFDFRSTPADARHVRYDAALVVSRLCIIGNSRPLVVAAD